MSTAKEMEMRMLAAQPLLDRHFKRIYDAFKSGILGPYTDRMLAEMRHGVKFTKHARRRGARGRKRALMAARWWRPVKLRIVGL